MSNLLKNILYTFLFLVFTSSVSLAQSNCELADETYTCFKDVRYGDESIQKYDLWLPNQSSFPVGRIPLVIYYHGGGYIQGEKEQGYKGSYSADRFLQKGYAYATVDYRLSGDAPFVKGMKFPPAMADGARALQHIRANAGSYNIDKFNIALMGSSAGGGIASWIAFKDNLKVRQSADLVERESTRVSCLALADTQITLNIPEVLELLNPAFVLDIGLPGLYGITPEDYLSSSEQYDTMLSSLYHRASPISHLGPEDSGIKVSLNYSLDYDSPDIHSPEFGLYLSSLEPITIASEYGRIHSLDSIGAEYSFSVNTGYRGLGNNMVSHIESCFSKRVCNRPRCNK